MSQATERDEPTQAEAPDRKPLRLRSMRQTYGQWSQRAQTRLEQERDRRHVVALGFVIVDRNRQTAASVLAGALAFRFFLTLLPLTLVFVVGLGYMKSVGGTPSQALKEFGIKGALAATVNQSAAFSDPGRAAVLALGLLGVFSGARTTTHTLRAIHALAWGIPVARWRRRGVAAMLFIGTAIVGFTCAGLASRARSDAGLVLGLGSTALLACVGAGIWFGVSRLLPHREGLHWRAFVPGAILVGVGFALLQLVTVNWIGPKLNHESSLYGSLGVAFVILGWLYVLGRLLVTAPLLNVALLHLQETTRRT